MILTDLQPRFVRYESRVEDYEVIEGDAATWRERGCPTKMVTGPREYIMQVETLAEAQGIWFLCPKCYAENIHKLPTGATDIEGAGIGIHQVQVTFDGRGVDPSCGAKNKQGPVRWSVSGSGYGNLTITPSVLVIGGCGWHGFVTNGEVSII